MKIVLVHSPGGPDALSVEDHPIPVPGDGEVLVRAQALGVGRPDVLIRRGIYRWMPPLPVSPGNELAGIVEALGPNAAGIAVGDRVLVSGRDLPTRGGLLADYVAVPASAVHPLPAGISAEAAVCLPNYQVAWAILHTTTGTLPKSALVIGAAGGVGGALAQLANLASVRVIGTISSREKADYAKSLGAGDTIDYRSEDVIARVLEFTGGRGVDAIFDPICGPGFANYLKILAPFGTLVSYSTFGGPPEADVFKAMTAAAGRCPALRVFSIHAFDHERERRRAMLDTVRDLFASGQIRPAIGLRLPITEARQAHEVMERGATLGKIILTPSELSA